MIIFGLGLYGKVQRSRQGLFIATQFFHIFFFPIGPINSYIVTERGFRKFKGIEIPTHTLSVFIAYLRALMIPGILVMIFLLIRSLQPTFDGGSLTSEEIPLIVLSSLILSVFIAMLIWSYFYPKIRHAPEEFAKLMAAQAGLDVAHDQSFNPNPTVN
jgi:hypothetical protein